MTGDEALIYLVDRMARDTTVDVARVEKMLELRRQGADRAADERPARLDSAVRRPNPGAPAKGHGRAALRPPPTADP